MNAREIIQEAQLYIGDPNVDFHDLDRILLALNRALNRISTRSRSIHESWYHPVIADQYQYALPQGALHIRKAKYRQEEWEDLDRGVFDDVEARAAASDGGPPQTFSVWQNAREERFVGTALAVNFDPQRDERLQRRVTFGLPNLEGAVRVGDLVFNLSAKHGEGIITSILGTDTPNTTQIAYSPLIGGTQDRFNVDDEIRITSFHTSGHVMIIAPAPVRTDEIGEESIAAFVAQRHRVITRTDMDNENDTLELDAEFNDTLMYEMLHWARVQETGLDSTAQLYRRLANEEYLTAIPLAENRIHQQLNAWEQRLSDGSTDSDVDVEDTT